MSRQAWWLGGVSLVLLVAVVMLGFWLRPDPSPSAPESSAVAPAMTMSASSMPPASTVVVPSTDSRSDVALPPVPDVATVDAVESLRQARLNGDASAPAVVRSPERELPTAAELADPEAYQRYEARQNERMYRSFVSAADSEIPKLQEQVAKGRAAGLSPEQIAEGEEKLRRIEAMRNQLMSDHPELNRPAAP